MNYPPCKYRLGIECGNWGDECERCGWNPTVEAERIAKLKSGDVKTYLTIDLKTLNNRLDYMHQKNRKLKGEADD